MIGSEPRWLGRLVADAAHFLTIREHGGLHGVRDENLLESARARPRHRWTYEPAVRLVDLAAAYGYGLIRNHPYVDGNKRVGLIVVTAFLDRNGMDLIATEPDVVATVLAVASGTMTEEALAAWIDDNTRRRPAG